MKTKLQRLRMSIWEKLDGCDCPPKQLPRCTKRAVRCDARRLRIGRDFKAIALDFTGHDPNATKVAKKRLDKALRGDDR